MQLITSNISNSFAESDSCSEGSVTVVSDVSGSSLQLVEMCSNEGVWCPVCDNNWTLEDATAVCKDFNGIMTNRQTVSDCVNNDIHTTYHRSRY